MAAGWWQALLLAACAAGAAGLVPNGDFDGHAAARRASDIVAGARYSTSTHVHLYGAPAATRVPLVVGFHTANLAAYAESSRSKLKVEIASGVDLSSFQLADVVDAVNVPEIAWAEATSTSVELFLEREPLRADSDYEVTLMVLTATSGDTLGSVTVSWYTYSASSQQWVMQEEAVENEAPRGGLFSPETCLASAALSTSSNSFSGSTVSAWVTSPTVTSVLVDLHMASVASGVVSIAPFPPSAWDFGRLNSTLGEDCPTSGELSFRIPPSATRCILRRRGSYVNSIDVWFLAADLTAGAGVHMHLPTPMAGTVGSWYVAYREWVDPPGYLVTPLELDGRALVALGPKPYGALADYTSDHPARTSVLSVSFRTGANMAYLTNSRAEIRVDSSVFAVEAGGCAFASGQRPAGAVVWTSTAQNACLVSWAPSSAAGAGTVGVTADGEVTGSWEADFHGLGVVGFNDAENSGGNSWHYLLAGGERFIVGARSASSASGETLEVLAQASANLVGSGTTWSSGTFTQRLVVGDHVVADGRTFVVTAVNSDTSADVTEGGAAPSSAVAAGSSYRVRWVSRVRVTSIHEESSGLTAVSDASYSFERAEVGAAFWSRTYGLTITGTNADTTAVLVATPEIRFYSGRDSAGDDLLDYWLAPFSGRKYRVRPPPGLAYAELHLTTVAAGTKARVMLEFVTGTSTRFTGSQDENTEAGMLLRLYTSLPAELQLFKADGTGLTGGSTEAEGLDCSLFLLEAWGDSGSPTPSACWWDAWSRAEPSVYMRFRPGSGLRMQTRYEFVFLAALSAASMSASGLLKIEILDGDGSVYLGSGSVVNTETLVDVSANGNADEPIVHGIEVIGGDPLSNNQIQVRLTGGTQQENAISASNIVRLFLFPLTAWNVPGCSVVRSDGAAVVCAIERVGRRANVVRMTLDQNSMPIGASSDVTFTITGMRPPEDGFFRGEIGTEVWFHPRESSLYHASYVTSVEGRLSASNFVSWPAASGSGIVASHTAPYMEDADNEVLVVYRPAVTCRSTAGVPCHLVVTAPDGFDVTSAGAPAAANDGYEAVPISTAPSCDRRMRTCTLVMRDGSALWAGAPYGARMVVSNPPFPVAADAPGNVWTVQLSGSDRWGFGLRATAQTATLSTRFAVLGRLGSAVVTPFSLVCGQYSYVRVHFVTAQRTPAGGVVRLTAPGGFELTRDSADRCFARAATNWPPGTSCTSDGTTATLVLGQALAAGALHAFDLEVRVPSESAASVGYWSLSTESAATPLDAAPRVTWSAQVDSHGGLAFPEVLGCWPRAVSRLRIIGDDLRPYTITWQAAQVTIEFIWTDMEIPESPVPVTVYAPAGFAWEATSDSVYFNATTASGGSAAAPVMLSPVQPASAAGANCLHLLATRPLQRHTTYAFTARARVPDENPGSAGNPASGRAWHAVFGTGASGGTRWATGTVTAQGPAVRVVSDFSARRSSTIPLEVCALTVAFETSSALPAGGRLLLELPSGFDFGSHLGQACASDAAWTQGSPWTDARGLQALAMACVTLAGSGARAFEWAVPVGGLAAGRFVATVFITNPASRAGTADRLVGDFMLRTYLDSARTVIADAPATAPAALPLLGMPQAELALEYVNPLSYIFNARPLDTTWVVFAFELQERLAPSFAIYLRAPVGFVFPSACEVHIGNGTSYTPLGRETAPEETDQYLLFPVNSMATCTGAGRDAQIAVQVPVEDSEALFPAVANKMYLFRVRVANPPVTPAVNDWLLRVGSQEYSGIPGYDLWQLQGVLVTPGNTAAGDVNRVTVQFTSKNAIRGIIGTSSNAHGILVMRMSEGFAIMATSSGNLPCEGFDGLRNVTGSLGPEVTCVQWPGDSSRLILHNWMAREIPAGKYTFTIDVRNPSQPADASAWELETYSGQEAAAEQLLDAGEADGFAVNTKMRVFGVEPSPQGQQSSGATVTLHIAMVPASVLLTGDAFFIRAPAEYVLECDGLGFQSVLMPRPSCSGPRAAFSFVGVNGTLLPRLLPLGSEGATLVTMQIQATNPAVKPAVNQLEAVHCRGVTDDVSTLLLTESGCPEGSQIIASVQYPLWNIVPQLQDPSVQLLVQKVAAQNRSTNMEIRFRTTSSGATRVQIDCPGMDFAGCIAEVGATSVNCDGSMGTASLTGVPESIARAGDLNVLYMHRMVNPVLPGNTTWSLTTFGPDAQGAEITYDRSADITGHRVLQFLSLDSKVACSALELLNPALSPGIECTASNPWYERQGNQVTLRFHGLHGGEIMNGHRLLIQPPLGYSFPPENNGVPTAVRPLYGFRQGEVLHHSTARNDSLDLGDGIVGLSDEVLLVNLTANRPMLAPFSIRLTVNNPFEDPPTNFNLWRFMLLDTDMTPLYTNDGDWSGFDLYGTFSDVGSTTRVESLVTNFPAEANIVRVEFSLMSPLAGLNLKMKITAPSGFTFAEQCLPADPNLVPQLNATTSTWLSSCARDSQNPNHAVLTIPADLDRGRVYGADFIVTNADASTDTSWHLYTFRNNELLDFVHYAVLPGFGLQVLEAFVFPEVRKYDESSMLHVSLRPMRDLGPHGQVAVTGPPGYLLFCGLNPFFDRGNLPAGVSCSGANNHALLRLSGGEFLEKGVSYYFAIRVTNPPQNVLTSTEPEPWSIRLQTRDRVLVHQSSQVVGYSPAAKAITRFGVAATSLMPNTETWLSIQFKLETPLQRARNNRLELDAPGTFTFRCATEQAQYGYVVPAETIRPASLDRFQDLVQLLETPAAMGLESYRNEGTTEDGRAIVDCEVVGKLSLAVDFTDDSTLGRYAFRVQAMNPAESPMPNIWTIRSYVEGLLEEEGGAGGYNIASDLPVAVSELGGQGTIESGAVPTAARASLAALLGPLLAAVRVA